MRKSWRMWEYKHESVSGACRRHFILLIDTRDTHVFGLDFSMFPKWKTARKIFPFSSGCDVAVWDKQFLQKPAEYYICANILNCKL